MHLLSVNSSHADCRPERSFFCPAARSVDWKNPEKALEVTGQFTGVPRPVLVEASKHFAWDHRVDLQAAVNVAKEGPAFGFTKTDTSAKVPSLFDLSFLAEATGKPIEQLDSLR